jgi:YVTN family beta-propeller protein
MISALLIIPSALANSNLLYSAHGGGMLTVADSSTHGVITSYSVGVGANWVIGNPAGTRVYVNDYSSDKIDIINPSTNLITATISLNGPSGMAINPSGSTMYAAMYDDDKIAVIDLTTNTIIKYITVGDGPFAVRITPDGTKVYVANNIADTFSIISTSSNTVTATIAGAQNGPSEFAFNSDASKVFVLEDQGGAAPGKIMVYDTSSNALLGTITLDNIIPSLSHALITDNMYVWAGVSWSMDKVQGYYADDYSFYADLALPDYNDDINDIALSGNKMYIAHEDNITVYDLADPLDYHMDANISTGNGEINGLALLSPSDTIIDIGAQPVYLYVHSYYVMRWENVTLSVYDDAGILLDSKQTDNNGAATFNLEPGSMYTLNAYSSALGIDTNATYTVPNSYSGSIQQGITVLPYTSWLNGNSAGGMTTVNNTTVENASFASGYQDRDIFLRTNTSRTGSVGYINNSFNDLSRLTTQVTFKLYKLNNSTNNYTLDQTAGVNLNTVTNSTWQNFTVLGVDASNKDYYVIAEANNTYYGNITRNNPANIPWQSLLPGVPAVWHTYLAVIVVVGIFACSVMWLNGIISLAGAGAAYVFYSLGWLDTVPGAGLGVAGAVIAAIVYYWSRRETGGLE